MPLKITHDPIDGLPVDEVGPWASEKHDRLRKYIDASRGARAKFLPPKNQGGASYIELFSGPGRSWIRDTSRIIDGSPLVAYRSAHAGGSRFSDLHLNDLKPGNSAALLQRMRALGASPNNYTDAADVAVDKIVAALNPAGLHFAFLDPYNLEQMPFSIIRKLATLPRMDMLIHVSLQDLQRNLDKHTRPSGVLDAFMPGWRQNVDPGQSINGLRAALLEFWLAEIRQLGTTPAEGIELVVGPNNQRLYWLVFVSAHDLGQKLWNAVRGLRGQSIMDF
jgi:three-Cys-motif partner protein